MGMRAWRRTAAIGAALTMGAIGAVVAPGGAGAADGADAAPDLTLTILHNNDGESSLLPAISSVDGNSYGGVARFQAKVDRLRALARRDVDPGESSVRGSLLLNSGDNYLAGIVFQASQQPGAPFYDGVAARLLGYDALGIGNHEFDFGPATFARFVREVGRGTPFVSANLDYSNEPALARVPKRNLVSRTILRVEGRRVGVVGLTTPSLPTISTPGGVEVLTDLAAIAQAEIDALTAAKVNRIILISHLQGLTSEIALASQLRDVDVIIGGGGDEILADEDTQLFPGHENNIFGSYPQVVTDINGVQVPIVTTPGNYRYVGQLQVTFDADGNVLSWDEEDSGIKVVTDAGPEGIKNVSSAQRRLVERPVAAAVASLEATVIGANEVVLDCERVEVRGLETNCGNLIADGLLAAAQAQAAGAGVDSPQMAIQNGGGIRLEGDKAAGPFTVADTFRLSPFGNIVSVAEDVPAETVRQIIEEGAIRLPASGDGGFVNLAGASVVIDPSFPARVANQTTGEQTSPGQRVRSLVLDDGTVLVEDGVTVDGVTVDIAGLNFSLRGGDAYPAVPFTAVGISDQQALQAYIQNVLGGVVTEADYPRGGEGRITIVSGPSPT